MLLISYTVKSAKIHQAIIDDDASCIEEILSKEPYMINAPDVAYGGWPPLHLAAFLGKLRLVKLLLAKGAPIWRTDILGKTALYYARENNQKAIVEFLAKFAGS